eukprot:gene11294-21472_t
MPWTTPTTLAIKAACGTETRRFRLSREATAAQLFTAVQREFFTGKEMRLNYVDNEGDVNDIVTDADWAECVSAAAGGNLSSGNTVKIIVVASSPELTPTDNDCTTH